MILRKLHLKNIRSYRDETIEFKEGITLFEGDIGSGKSSILNAIEFVLFGLGDQNGSHLLRVGENEGKVELTVEVNDKEYTFGRGLVKKRSNVSQDQCYITEGDTKTNYNATEMKRRALQILNFREPTNPRSQSVIYRYAVFTPQEQMREVIRLKPEARKETLRKALGVEEYSIAAGNATAVLTDLRSEVRFLESSRAEAERIQERIKGEETRSKEIKGKIGEAQALLGELSGKKLKVNEELAKKRAEEDEFRQLNQRYQLLDQEKRQLEISIGTNAKSLEETKDRLKLARKAQESYVTLTPRYEEYRKARSDFPKLQRRNELFNSLKQKIELIKTDVNSKRENLQSQLEARIEELSDLSEKMEALDVKIAKLPELAVQISGLEGQTDGIESLRESNVQSQNRQGVLQQEIRHLEGLRKEKQDEWGVISSMGIGAVCPRCQQELSENHYRLLDSKIAEEVKGIEEQSREKKAGVKELIDKISDEKAQLSELGRKERSLNKLRLEKAELVKDQETHSRYIDQEAKARERSVELEKLLDNDAFAAVKNEEIKLLEEQKSKLSEDVGKFGDLKSKIDELEESEIESQFVQAKTVAERIPELTSSMEALESERERLGETVQKVKGNIASFSGELKKYEGLKDQLSKLQEEEKSLLQGEATQNALIKAFNTDITGSGVRVKELESDLSRHQENLVQAETLQIVEIWLRDILVPGFQAIEKNILQSLNQEFNKLFKRWFGNLIESEELQGLVDENFSPIVEQSGYELDVESLSGGEKTSVALAYRLALNTVVKQVTSTMKSNLLILDEPTDGFSKEQLFKMRDILNELDCQQIILVSHEKELEGIANFIYRVRKEGNTSTITPPN